ALAPRQGGAGTSLRALTTVPTRRVREQLRQFLERTLCLGDRAHLDPMTEYHDGDERRELPPQLRTGKSECHRQAEPESNGDRERDQRHHPGQAIANLAHRPLNEHPAAVREYQGPEESGDPS